MTVPAQTDVPIGARRPPRVANASRLGARRVRRWFGWALTAAVLASLTLLGLEKIDPAEVGHAFARVDGRWVAVGMAAMIGAFLARGESWFGAIRAALPDRSIGRPAVTRVLLIGMAGSTVAPGRLGEAARAWLIARRVGATRETLATVIGTLLSQSLLNLVALTILAGVALAGGAIPGAHAEAVVLVAMIPAGIVTLLSFGPRLASATATARLARLGRFGRGITWVGLRLGEVRHGLIVLRRPRTAVHSVGFQLGAWAMQCATCYSVLLAFGLERKAGIATAAAILLAVNITAAIPLTPSNVGVFQAACIAVLVPTGVRAGTGLAYGLVLQAIEVFSALALGLPALLHEGLSPAELSRQTRRNLTPVTDAVPSELSRRARS